MLLIPPAAPDAGAAGGDARAIVIPGQVVAGRRVPTRDEIAKINAALPPLTPDDGPVVTAGGYAR